VDNSQIKLSETLDNTSEAEFNLNNLNSVFYEHLMASLQNSLNKEIEAGRLGVVSAGDFFIIVNDKLTAMLHIIEVGNGFCTFQIRGMEFKGNTNSFQTDTVGTYCQEREIEAINRTDYTNDNDNKFFPKPMLGLPKILSFKDLFTFRWNSWEVINTCTLIIYILLT
jgi:hypothetical protein